MRPSLSSGESASSRRSATRASFAVPAPPCTVEAISLAWASIGSGAGGMSLDTLGSQDLGMGTCAFFTAATMVVATVRVRGLITVPIFVILRWRK